MTKVGAVFLDEMYLVWPRPLPRTVLKTRRPKAVLSEGSGFEPPISQIALPLHEQGRHRPGGQHHAGGHRKTTQKLGGREHPPTGTLHAS